jgi:hypothetical protein
MAMNLLLNSKASKKYHASLADTTPADTSVPSTHSWLK